MTRLSALDLLPERGLARGLLAGDPALSGLVTHDPAEPAALVASAHIAAARELDRDSLVNLIDAGQRALDAPLAAFAASARLREVGTVAVVTGQQPGLLGGPLMVLIKALAAAAVARQLERQGVPAVAVYWHASEDHDHGEADHVVWPGPSGLDRLRLALPEDGRMLSAVAVPDGARALVERVLGELPPGRGSEALAGALPPRGGESYGTWTGRLMARILGSAGIVVVEPASLRGPAAAVARYELERAGELHAGVERALQRVRRAGYDAPLSLVRPDLLFHVERSTGHRRPLETRAGQVSAGGASASVDAWLERHTANPDLFSWNVAARVLAQDVALPVAAQICGPAELGYVSLLREGHASLGVPQPVALLRPSVTLVERAVLRACAKLGVEIGDVVRRGAAALPEAPLSAAPALARLGEAIAELPDGTSPAARRRRAELVRQARLFGDALRREATDADQLRTRRNATILAGVRPGGRPMERVVAFLPWYARGGDAFVSALLEQLGTGAASHLVLSAEDL